MNSVILSVGGSLLIPADGINIDFLNSFNRFIRSHIATTRFLLVVGGGGTTRQYQGAAKTVSGSLASEDIDWLGIHITRLNAHLVRTVLKDISHPRIIENYDHKLENWHEPVVIGAGWKPGWSTDYDAVILARDYNVPLVINMTNIYYVYNKDPKKFSDAVPYQNLSWSELEKIVGTQWIPGANYPFDPIASQLAKQLKLRVITTKGDDFDNLNNILANKDFKGTVIQ